MAKKKSAALKRRPTRSTRASTSTRSTAKTLVGTVVVLGTVVPQLKPGEAYAGILIKDGKPQHHVILLPGSAAAVTWADAKKWAEGIRGELPTRKEQALLFANAGEHFEKAYYWSGEEVAVYAEYAWGQNFSGGYQNLWRKGTKDRARAVRRVAI